MYKSTEKWHKMKKNRLKNEPTENKPTEKFPKMIQNRLENELFLSIKIREISQNEAK